MQVCVEAAPAGDSQEQKVNAAGAGGFRQRLPQSIPRVGTTKVQKVPRREKIERVGGVGAAGSFGLNPGNSQPVPKGASEKFYEANEFDYLAS